MELLRSESKGNVLEFEPKKHVYRLNGEIVPGSTKALKRGYPTSEALLNWLRNNGRAASRLSSEAADIGKTVHRYAELHANGQSGKFDWEKLADHKDLKLIKKCINHYLEWDEQNKTKTIGTEVLVASTAHKVAGTLDRLDLDEQGEHGISDYKTSAGFYVDNFLQMALYRLQVREWLDLDIKWLRVLKFGKKNDAFHTLTLNKHGWFLDDKMAFSDPYALLKVESQALRCVSTMKFCDEQEPVITDINDKVKVSEG
jgi:hypothetical protein